MSTKRILTGMRPTGALHLGHYVGALKQWIELQDEYECFFLIADVQALTTHVDRPKVIEESVREVVLDWLGVGLDPAKPNVHFVLQSSVPELTELTAYFTMLVPFARMEHNPTIRAELKDLKQSPTAGFMVYPISQAADILLFSPHPRDDDSRLLVPVGEDQVPHLEETNQIARRFNNLYGKTFLECKPKVGEVGRLPGIDGKSKMSKSLGNVIQLKDDSQTVQKLVSKMFTDPKKLHRGDAGHSQRCPVYLYHRVFSAPEMLRGRAAKCKTGRLGCVECKKELADILNRFLEPIRTRRTEAEKAPLGIYLHQGAEKAREIGQDMMTVVRHAMHLDYPSVFRN